MPSVKFKEPSNLENKEPVVEPVVEPLVESVKTKRSRKPKTDTKTEEKTTDEVKPEKKKRTRKPKADTPPVEEKAFEPVKRRTRKPINTDKVGKLVNGVIVPNPKEKATPPLLEVKEKTQNKWQVHLKKVFAENKGNSFSDVMKIARESYVK